MEGHSVNDVTDAFILKESDYRENDVLMTVLSKDYGKISFVVPGARKPKSHNARNILPYSEVQLIFDYHEGKTLFRLRSAHTLSLFRHMRSSLLSSAAAGVIAEAMEALIMEKEGASEEEYALLKASFEALDTGHDVNTVLGLFLADLLRLFGSAPDVDECTVCGSKAISALSVKHGGFLCKRHAEEYGTAIIDKEELLRFRILVKAGMAKAAQVEAQYRATFADVKTLVSFVNRYTGTNLRSFAFFETISDLNRDR